MKYTFSGPLAALIQRHLELQRALGFELRNANYTLAAFDRFLSEYFPQAQAVTRSMVLEFCKTMGHLHNNTRSLRLGHIRQFCRFLFQLNPDSYVPGSDLLPRRQPTRLPYLYNHAEVVALMRLARQLKPLYPLRAESMESLIGLLWVTGLRISEALRLNLEDVDLAQQLLKIKETKHHKSRLVPISASAASALKEYAQLREKYASASRPNAPFFTCVDGRRWQYETSKKLFGRMVRQLGLKTEHGKPARLHDLRHSFATRCLTNFYQASKDPNSHLSVLATYLGHACVTYTALYLHPQTKLLEAAGARFKAHLHEVSGLTLGGENAGC